jgi:hypothetical protein
VLETINLASWARSSIINKNGPLETYQQRMTTAYLAKISDSKVFCGDDDDNLSQEDDDDLTDNQAVGCVEDIQNRPFDGDA